MARSRARSRVRTSPCSSMATPVVTTAAFEVAAGARLRFGARRAGARAYLAVRGGFDVEPVFGSRATSVVSRMGPFDGRPLKAGDRLPVGSATGAALPAGTRLRLPAGGARLRVLPGPHDWNVHRRRSGDAVARALHGDAAVQSHGVPAGRGTAPTCRSRRHPVGRDADGIAAGALVRPADPADGRSADDRRLPEDRDRDHRGLPIGRTTGAGRLDRIHAAARAPMRSTP